MVMSIRPRRSLVGKRYEEEKNEIRRSYFVALTNPLHYLPLISIFSKDNQLRIDLQRILARLLAELFIKCLSGLTPFNQLPKQFCIQTLTCSSLCFFVGQFPRSYFSNFSNTLQLPQQAHFQQAERRQTQRQRPFTTGVIVTKFSLRRILGETKTKPEKKKKRIPLILVHSVPPLLAIRLS